MKIIKFMARCLCYIIGKIQWWLHNLFLKHIPIISCYGCLNDLCGHRVTKHNAICYYHTKNNRKIGGK